MLFAKFRHLAECIQTPYKAQLVNRYVVFVVTTFLLKQQEMAMSVKPTIQLECFTRSDAPVGNTERWKLYLKGKQTCLTRVHCLEGMERHMQSERYQEKDAAHHRLFLHPCKQQF